MEKINSLTRATVAAQLTQATIAADAIKSVVPGPADAELREDVYSIYNWFLAKLVADTDDTHRPVFAE